VLTIVQIFGVLALASGIPLVFEAASPSPSWAT